jgi:hypothetical protein
MADRYLARFLQLLAITLAVLGPAAGCTQTTGGDSGPAVVEEPSRVLPWEWWRDLMLLTRTAQGDRVVMHSSHCPSGCEFDRHSKGDSRFITTNEKGEGVIFSAEGAGAVTRIWMVMGDGISDPLDPAIRIRVRVDGRRRPVVDLALPDLFDGSSPPFVRPLVEGLTTSGGGHVSYVPIPFRDGCEISLVGADNAKIWFQVTARLLADGAGVRPFDGRESTTTLAAALELAGSDPWDGGPSPTTSGTITLRPGGGEIIATFDGPDVINGVVIRTPRKHWPRLGLRFTFDDREPQLIPVSDLFAVPATDGEPSRSLFVGADDEGDLYCYFPMPFFERAVVELLRRPVEGPTWVKVNYALRSTGTPPPPDAGYFGVQARQVRDSGSAGKITLLDLDGRGSWVGLMADLSPVNGTDWTFLEGDERVFVDGEQAPSLHGTGVEDFFNGGFYFRGPNGKPTVFRTALAGAPYFRQSRAKAVMYRLLLGDAVVFDRGIRVELEAGQTGELGLRARTVAYYYLADPAADPAATQVE